jgi:hypothetical protein
MDTYVHLGDHAGFEDALRTGRKIMMAYLWAFPFLAMLYFSSSRSFSGAGLVWILVGALVVLSLLRLARLFISVQLVLDRERQQLLLRRKLFGFTHLVSLAGVEELWGVATAGEVPAAPVNYWWDYVTLLITRSGQRFRAARHGDSFTEARRRTEKMAGELGLSDLGGKEGHKAVVYRGTGTPRVEFRKFYLRQADCLAALFWALMVFLSPFLVGYLLKS